MKKRFVIFSLVVLCLSIKAQAQRYLSGQTGLQFTLGTVNGLNLDTKSQNFSFHFGAKYSTYTKNSNRWVIGCDFLEKRHPYKDISIPQTQITGEAGYFLKFLSNGSKTTFFSLGASAVAGYETINWGEKLLSDGARIENRDNFIYGGAITLETEFFLSDRIVLLINIRERLLGGSSVGKLNTQLGIGLKFILN